ncbi:MAG: hypothetical protein GY861_11265 [bacterium]|nr:hypothetical protein [bacterium]
MAFPGRIPVPAQNPYPNEPVYGNIWSDVGSGLRQTGGDVDEFAEQKSVKATRQAQIQDMIEKRKQALAVQAAKEEYERKQMILDEAKQAEIEREHKAAETLETRKWDEAKANREAKEKADIALAGQRDRSPVSRSGSGRGSNKSTWEDFSDKPKIVKSALTNVVNKELYTSQQMMKANTKRMVDIKRNIKNEEALLDKEGTSQIRTTEGDLPSTTYANPDLDALSKLQDELEQREMLQVELLKRMANGSPDPTTLTTQAPTQSDNLSQLAIDQARAEIADPNTPPDMRAESEALLKQLLGE